MHSELGDRNNPIKTVVSVVVSLGSKGGMSQPCTYVSLHGPAINLSLLKKQKTFYVDYRLKYCRCIVK